MVIALMILRKFAFFALAVSFASILSGCHEDEKIMELRKEISVLETRTDSLESAIQTMGSVKPLTIIVDTVRADEGPFHLFQRLDSLRWIGVENKDKSYANDLGKVYSAMQDSVEFKLRVGEKFYIAVDADGHVQRFRYAPNVITSHVVVNADSGYAYKLIEKPVVKKQSVYEGALEEGSTLNGILLKVGIPRRMVGIVSGVLQCKVAFPLARKGDQIGRASCRERVLRLV